MYSLCTPCMGIPSCSDYVNLISDDSESGDEESDIQRAIEESLQENSPGNTP